MGPAILTQRAIELDSGLCYFPVQLKNTTLSLWSEHILPIRCILVVVHTSSGAMLCY